MGTKRLLLLVVAFFLAFLSGRAFGQGDTLVRSAQFETRPSVGIIGGIALNEYSTAFRYLPGVPACSPIYKSGHGIGSSVGALFNLPLTSQFAFSVRGVYTMNGGLLTVDEPTTISVAGVATAANIQHTIQASLGLLDLEPGISFEVLPALRIFAGAGIGYLLSTNFDQKETLTQPADVGVFENGSRSRNEQTGKLPNAATIVASVLGGINYLLPLNASRTLSAMPEVSWSQWLTSPVKGLSWNVGSLRGSVAILYTIPEALTPPVIVPPAPAPTVGKKIPALVASLTARGIDADGSEQPVATVKVEEVYETHLAPLVPYIFFEQSSATVADRYRMLERTQVDTFALRSLNGTERLTMYRNVLNILGRRLLDKPSAHITLTGCTAMGTETGGRTLSKARAAAVKTYLTSAWNIPSDRIRVEGRELLQNYSPRNDTDGIAENRRVEITSNDPSILAPLSLSDTLRESTPPLIRFYPNAVAGAGVASWTIDVSQGANILKSYTGAILLKTVDWDLNTDQKHVPTTPGRIEAVLHVTDSINSMTSARDTLSVLQVTLVSQKREFAGDAELQHYSLLLFDFKSSELSSRDREVLTFIKSHIQKNSVVTVVGYADRIGNAEVNRTLANARAQAAAAVLGVQNGKVSGSDQLLYDNATPEGRFYSRTVEVTITTPKDSAQ